MRTFPDPNRVLQGSAEAVPGASTETAREMTSLPQFATYASLMTYRLLGRAGLFTPSWLQRKSRRAFDAIIVVAALGLAGCTSGPGAAGDTEDTHDTGDLTPVEPTGNIIEEYTLPDGTVVQKTSDGFTISTAPDGTKTVVAPDGTKTVTHPDGTIVTTAPDGTVTTVHPDGTVTTMPPDGTTTTGDQDPGPVYINAAGHVEAARNSFGIEGYWYAFGDGKTSTQMGNPYLEGKYCITGTASGKSGDWGVGMGLDLKGDASGNKEAFPIDGVITGFKIKIAGELPAPARLHFVNDPDMEVSPFIEVSPGDAAVVYNIVDAQVPFTWDVDNAGARVENGVLYSVQLLAPGDSEQGPINVCIEEFEPIFDPSVTGGTDGGVFINSDGFVAADTNDFSITGPVYVISDGKSTDQTGVPYREGKYCVTGEFTGSSANWGAGIALDLNKAPGMDRLAYDPTGKLAGFRIGLSGSTPGAVRVQYIINEPQDGTQPLLVGQLNSSSMYRLDWAQVPTSWDIAEAGLEVTNSVVTLQVIADGSEAGPFEICIDELEPLGPDDLSYEASAPAAGQTGHVTFDPARLESEYAKWKGVHFQDCGDDTACVPRDDGDCISEGIGYGMLITAAFDDQAAFDKLWNYFKKHRRSTGMMNWQTTACGAAISDGAATDGDLDAAMALLQASCRWGATYRTDALALINAIEDNAVASCSGGSVLKPGDTFGGCNETDPSYLTPAYFKIFQELTGSAVWTSLTDKGYTLLAGNQTRKGGLFSDWSNDSGGAATAGDHSDDFGPDASRVPWRLATDYAWFNEARAVPLLDTFREAVIAEGGPARAFTPNSNFRGGSAFSAIVADGATAAEFTDAWLMTAVDDDTYFPGTLRLVYMLLAAGKFPKDCP